MVINGLWPPSASARSSTTPPVSVESAELAVFQEWLVNGRRAHRKSHTVMNDGTRRAGGTADLGAFRRASPPAHRHAWEADTLPAELLPLGAGVVIADRASGGVGSGAGSELRDPGGPAKDSSVPGEQTSPVGDRLVGRAVCGSPLVGSLTVVRLSFGQGSEPDPSRPCRRRPMSRSSPA